MSAFAGPLDDDEPSNRVEELTEVASNLTEASNTSKVDQGRLDRNDVLEQALVDKMNENVLLLQQIMEKEALLKEATATIESVQKLVDKHDQDVLDGKAVPLALPAGGGGIKAIRAVHTGPPLPLPDGDIPAKITATTAHDVKSMTTSSDVAVGRDEEVRNPERIGTKLAPFNPTNDDACKIALELLDISSDSPSSSMLYDLGCGDARLLTAACLICPHINCIGIEYDSEVYQRALTHVSACDTNNIELNISNRITLLHDNVLNISLLPATHIFIYLVPEGMKALREQLCDALRRGVRIVTYIFSLPDVVPTQVILYKGSTKLYLYTNPP